MNADEFQAQIGYRMQLIMEVYARAKEHDTPEMDQVWSRACADLAIAFLEPRETTIPESEIIAIADEVMALIRERLRELRERN